MNGFSALMKGTPERVLALLPPFDDKEVGSLQPRKGYSPEPDHAGILISDEQPPEL